MRFRNSEGMTAEVIHLSMTSQTDVPRITDVGDGYWLIVRHPNLREAGRVKLPPLLTALAYQQPDSQEIVAWLSTSLIRFGMNLVELEHEDANHSPAP